MTACSFSAETPTATVEGQVMPPSMATQTFNPSATIIQNTPTGEAPTSTPTYCTATATQKPSSTPTSDPTTIPLPDVHDIPDKEGKLSDANREEAIAKYGEIRQAVYTKNQQYVESTGKIRDDVLATLIIAIEFGDTQTPYENFYKEALEALSNEYDFGRKIGYHTSGKMQCYSNCSVETQIEWLYDMQAIRNESIVDDKIIKNDSRSKYL